MVKKKFFALYTYRVNNLGKDYHDSIMNTIQTFYKVRNPRKIFIIGPHFRLLDLTLNVMRPTEKRKEYTDSVLVIKLFVMKLSSVT